MLRSMRVTMRAWAFSSIFTKNANTRKPITMKASGIQNAKPLNVATLAKAQKTYARAVHSSWSF